MTAEQFTYWMQGFAELTGDEPPTAAQWKSMREHLATVFTKVTPPFDPSKLPPTIPYKSPTDASKNWWEYPQFTCSSGGTALLATVTC